MIRENPINPDVLGLTELDTKSKRPTDSDIDARLQGYLEKIELAKSFPGSEGELLRIKKELEDLARGAGDPNIAQHYPGWEPGDFEELLERIDNIAQPDKNISNSVSKKPDKGKLRDQTAEILEKYGHLNTTYDFEFDEKLKLSVRNFDVKGISVISSVKPVSRGNSVVAELAIKIVPTAELSEKERKKADSILKTGAIPSRLNLSFAEYLYGRTLVSIKTKEGEPLFQIFSDPEKIKSFASEVMAKLEQDFFSKPKMLPENIGGEIFKDEIKKVLDDIFKDTNEEGVSEK